jgi:hypothetical protein
MKLLLYDIAGKYHGIGQSGDRGYKSGRGYRRDTRGE